MVFEDLSSFAESKKRGRLAIAPVGDRVLAFFFDVVLFSPIFSLVLSQLFKRVELKYYTSPDSVEFSVLLGISVLGVAVLTIFAQAIFLTLFQATPGKVFFKMQVVSLTGTGNNLRFSQALLRSGLWCLEFFLFAIPFAEVMSQRHRRPLHDRAADTMVITLKRTPDPGPFPVETQFVRHFLFAVVCFFLFWGSAVVVRLYGMASRGDFKREELVHEQYLCPTISNLVAEGQSRLDLALGRYLAGETDEGCLLSEADFALWTENDRQKAWAYLGKAFYYQYDVKKSDSYFKKVCEAEGKGEPCRLSTLVLSGQRSDLMLHPGSTLTGQMLSLRELISRGKFESVLLHLKNLSYQSGFSGYVQKETVKALWALQRHERALGAYDNSWPHMESRDQAELAAWLCLEEVEQKCENRDYGTCQDLWGLLRSQNFEEVSVEGVIALVKQRECKKSSEPSLLVFHKILEDREGLRNYVEAISSESPWGAARRLHVLKGLAFSAREAGSRAVQRQAIVSLLQISRDPNDFEKVFEYLKTSDRHDMNWLKVARIFLDKTDQFKWAKLNEKLYALFGAEEIQQQGFLAIQNRTLRSPEARRPAQVDPRGTFR